MSCCDGWDHSAEAIEICECPYCGEQVDQDGDAIYGCYWSPVICDKCGSAPCDLSC